MIVKNEAHNLPRLFQSIEGCFDEIHITDTGSTDNTIAVAKGLGATVHHFTWVQDFAKARNYSFMHATTDYICWLDGDDILNNKEEFIKWRDNAMCFADYWLATYNYAFLPTGKPGCFFARERVLKNHLGLKWKYFLHEGVLPNSPVRPVGTQYATTWTVDHQRSVEDIAKDRNRNIEIFEKHLDELDPRMNYYYGKELFEAEKPEKAIEQLKIAVLSKSIELHDRVLALQYLCLCLLKVDSENHRNSLMAKEYAYQGLMLMPNRAEFYCFIGDACIKMGQLYEAIPSYYAALSCVNQAFLARGIASPLFSFEDSYTTYPYGKLIEAYANLGQYEKSLSLAKEAIEKYPGNNALKVAKEQIEKHAHKIVIPKSVKETSDIVFTCPPHMLYQWDWDIYQNKGIGGSETAVCEMAYWLKRITGRRVIVFNDRDTDKTCEGVEYVSNSKTQSYFQEYKPAIHIAWRHNLKATDAKTLLWCHDLMCPNIEISETYEKVLCLSEFHKNFLNGLKGVPLEKIALTRNGISPKRFENVPRGTRENVLIFSSSPDRGLDRAMLVMDRVIKEIPDAKLKVFYGFDNMEKFKMFDQINPLKKMIAERPYVEMVGNVDQMTLAREFSKAKVWVYPTNFLETYCITALEALASGCYPVVRSYGALPHTLGKFAEKGMATIVDSPCESEKDLDLFSGYVVDALVENKWQNVNIDLGEVSWESVAREWVRDWLQ